MAPGAELDQTREDLESDMTEDRFEGCLLGLALGDALGAPYEGGLIERAVWKLIGTTRNGECRWTDDTQMALDLASSLLESDGLDPDALARRFAAGYRWSRGYGPGAAKVLKRIARGVDWREANVSVYPKGSFGNGGAMRAPVVGLFFAHSPSQLHEAAEATARITHSHRLGLDGSVMIAAATAAALRNDPRDSILKAVSESRTSEPFPTKLATATGWLDAEARPGPREVARRLGNGIAAADSCVTSLYLALRFLESPFTDLVAFVIACKGDTDTIASMAGAIWGAARGASELPSEHLDRLEQRGHITNVARRLFKRLAV